MSLHPQAWKIVPPTRLPHYFRSENRDDRISRSDGPTSTPAVIPSPQQGYNAHPDPALAAALDVLRHVASLDPDHARDANALGFSRADVAAGHRLADLTPEDAAACPALAAAVHALAARYRRQATLGLRWAAGIDRQRDLFA